MVKKSRQVALHGQEAGLFLMVTCHPVREPTADCVKNRTGSELIIIDKFP